MLAGMRLYYLLPLLPAEWFALKIWTSIVALGVAIAVEGKAWSSMSPNPAIAPPHSPCLRLPMLKRLTAKMLHDYSMHSY